MAYFDCIVGGSGKGNTLVVTCADDLAGATITCTNGTKTYTKTCPSTSPYEVTFYGLEAGTWTVSATVSGNTYTTTVVITDYEAELGGFNWKTWVDLSENYTSSDFTDLDELLDTELAVRELMTIHACVDYLAGIAAESADVETIIGNDLAAKWINLRDYALDTLYANEVIADYMDEADKYFYGEWALMPQVPTMSSNTAPYGTVSAISVYNNDNTYAAWKAFDGDNSSMWVSNSTDKSWIGYKFTNPTCVKMVEFLCPDVNSITRFGTILTLQGSNDGFVSDTNNIKEISIDATMAGVKQKVKVDNSNYYLEYRIIGNGTSQLRGAGFASLQFYAWAPKGNVPVMTSNTAPYGQASTNSAYGASGYEAYRAFDNNTSDYWQSGSSGTSALGRIAYKFTNPVCVKKVLHRMSTAANSTYKVQYSDDGTNWYDVADSTYSISQNVNTEVNISNNEYHLYWAAYHVSSVSTTRASASILQFYGRELSVSVPVMTSNTAPYGVASASSSVSDNTLPWKAMQNTDTTTASVAHPSWISGSASAGEWIEYDFGKKVSIKMVIASSKYCALYSIGRDGTFKVQATDDDSTVVDVSENLTWHKSSGLLIGEVSDSVGHNKVRLTTIVGNRTDDYTHFGMVQFYGLDYSEREFETGVTKKWLYDHGVELETAILRKGSANGTATTKESSQIYLNNGGSANGTTCYADALFGVDFTDYSVVRAKVGDKFNASTNGTMNLRIVSSLNARPENGSYVDTYNIAAATFKNSDSVLPNNLSVDCSAVNQSAYIAMECVYYYGASTSFKELWLE